METAFASLPTTFDSDAFARMIVKDAEKLLRKNVADD
jgi:hypothetical protein